MAFGDAHMNILKKDLFLEEIDGKVAVPEGAAGLPPLRSKSGIQGFRQPVFQSRHPSASPVLLMPGSVAQLVRAPL